MQVQKFGIEALDNMLGGGLRSGRPYIISGNSGTGKTVLALRFLYEGLKMGEKCLYIATDKPPHSTITSISDSFGWDLLSLNVMDAVPTPSLYSTVYPVRDVTAKGEIREISEMSKNVEKGELTYGKYNFKTRARIQGKILPQSGGGFIHNTKEVWCRGGKKKSCDGKIFQVLC